MNKDPMDEIWAKKLNVLDMLYFDIMPNSSDPTDPHDPILYHKDAPGLTFRFKGIRLGELVKIVYEAGRNEGKF